MVNLIVAAGVAIVLRLIAGIWWTFTPLETFLLLLAQIGVSKNSLDISDLRNHLYALTGIVQRMLTVIASDIENLGDLIDLFRTK